MLCNLTMVLVFCTIIEIEFYYKTAGVFLSVATPYARLKYYHKDLKCNITLREWVDVILQMSNSADLTLRSL